MNPYQTSNHTAPPENPERTRYIGLWVLISVFAMAEAVDSAMSRAATPSLWDALAFSWRRGHFALPGIILILASVAALHVHASTPRFLAFAWLLPLLIIGMALYFGGPLLLAPLLLGPAMYLTWIEMKAGPKRG